MRKRKQHEYIRAYNARAMVDAGGSQLLLGARMSANARDRRALVGDVKSIPSSLGTVTGLLADDGCATCSEVAQPEQPGMEELLATTDSSGDTTPARQ